MEDEPRSNELDDPLPPIADSRIDRAQAVDLREKTPEPSGITRRLGAIAARRMARTQPVDGEVRRGADPLAVRAMAAELERDARRGAATSPRTA